MKRERCILEKCVFNKDGFCQTMPNPYIEDFVIGGEPKIIRCFSYREREEDDLRRYGNEDR